MIGLYERGKISIVITPTAGGPAATPVNSSAVDMNGFSAVAFLVQVGAVAAGAVTSVKAQQDSSAGMATAADLAGSLQTISDTDDDRMFYLELAALTKPFVRIVVQRGTANATVSAIAIQGGSSKLPITHGSNVAGKFLLSPAEGTP